MAFKVLNPSVGSLDPYTIYLNENDVAPAIENFTYSNNRGPSEKELAHLVDLYVLEEIFYRESIALGMNENDPAVKRLLALRFQEFIKNQTSLLYPDDDSLKVYYSSNQSKFAEVELLCQ